MTISRRNLLKSGALAASGALAMGALSMAGCSAENAVPAANEGTQGTTASENQTADVVIIGEGMGGLTAGVRALENGVKNVIIVETSKWPGGGSSFSLGGIHANGMGNTEELYKKNTRYQSTSKLAIDSFLGINDLLEWLKGYDLPVEIKEPSNGDAQTGNSASDMLSGNMLNAEGESGLTGCINFFDAYEDLFESMGGTVMHEVTARKVIMDDASKITGVLCLDSNNQTFTISTNKVVLACGGWQNNEEMKQRYLGHDAWQSANMGTPYNTGAGIMMAQECGASLQGDFGHFAGLFVPALPAKNWMDDVEAYETYGYDWDEGGKWWLWMEIIDAIPNTSILVNNSGQRFCDEGRFRHSYEPAMAQQEHATGIILCDSKTWNGWMAASGWGLEPGLTNQDRIDAICSDEIGGAYFQGNTLEELADAMNETGIATYAVHKANLVQTVADYNAAAEAGTGADLTPERVTYPCEPISEPPYYALPIRNAIFATFGGVAINEQAQVLDVARRPIEGLYATEPCAGGMMQEFYAGSIAHAGVTGFWAADDIASKMQA